MIEETASYDVILDGEDTGQYAYRMNQGIGVKYSPPSDVFVNNNKPRCTQTYKWSYLNFFITLSEILFLNKVELTLQFLQGPINIKLKVKTLIGKMLHSQSYHRISVIQRVYR